MTNPFQIIAEKLGELGVYDFLLPWLITSAIIWALLKKSNLFGENAIVINSVLSISISFFIWGFIIFTGDTTVGSSLSKFFTQMTFVAIGFVVMLIIGSMFFPDFTTALKEKIPPTMFWIILVIGIILLISTGLFKIGDIFYNLLHSFSKVPGGDVGLLVIAIIFLILLLLIISAIGGG